MKTKFTYLLALAMVFLSFTTSVKKTEVNDDFKLLTTNTEFEAGSNVILKFSINTNKKPNLYVTNSYGSTIIDPVLESGILSYSIPETITRKTGVVNWKLLSNPNTVSGKLNILPKQKVATMETYLGPPSIETGGTDYAMLVVIPTDALDNPLADSTKIRIKHQFLENLNNDTIIIRNSIAYKNIYSKTKTGRILVSSECLSINSKEYTINVLPAIPTNFNISYQRNHEFADGNQITSFLSSIIKDRYGNIVSDGTYVDFFVTNTSKSILKTSGTTINGIATAKMIHPDHEDSWTVKAFIEGMAESNSITLDYKQALTNFEVEFSKNNRIITVGPLKSFMNQMIPDGLEISLSIYKNNMKLETISKSSFEGFTTFKLDTNNFPSNTYNIKIKAAGIEKTYPNIEL